MANIQKGTFNTIAQGSADLLKGNFPVWARVDKLFAVGGTIDLSGYSAGDVIQAGSMVSYDQATRVATIVANDGDVSEVNGLVFEDVCIPEGAIHATCAIVRAGRIYADRVGDGLPAEVEAKLPMIEFVREA